MTEENDILQPGEDDDPGTAGMVATSPEAVPAAPEPSTSPAGNPPPGRFQRFLRAVLLWLALAGVVFLSGLLTDHFVRYRPMEAALNDRQAQLQADLDSTSLHIELLEALVEIKTAQIELCSGNVAGAKAALSGTAARLEVLRPAIEPLDAALAGNILARLDLILTGIDNDPVTAQADLGLLASQLQSVETLLFDRR